MARVPVKSFLGAIGADVRPNWTEVPLMPPLLR
jgi:hypothetical protein